MTQKIILFGIALASLLACSYWFCVGKDLEKIIALSSLLVSLGYLFSRIYKFKGIFNLRICNISSLILLFLVFVFIICSYNFCPICKCEYKSVDDKTTIQMIVEGEAKAVENKDLEMLKSIFSDNAVLTDSILNQHWYSPLDRYSSILKDYDYSNSKNSINKIMINGNTAYCTCHSTGNYREIGSMAFSPYDDITKWILRKNNCGCWVISNFTFNTPKE